MEPSCELYNFLTLIKEKLELINILEERNSWQTLMAHLPKTVKSNDYNCDTTNLAYNSLHIKQIEQVAARHNQKCSEILLNDWSEPLDGDFPSLGHLLDVLIKSELYWAAEYVAVTLLKQEPPQRPNKGPVAKVELNPDVDLSPDTDLVRNLDNMYINSSLISQVDMMKSVNTNMNYSSPGNPMIIITPDEGNLPDFSMLMRNQSMAQQEEVSDMMKFSATQPIESNTENESSYSVNNTIPDVVREIFDDKKSEDNVGNIPAFSELLNNSTSHKDSTTVPSENTESEVNIPDLNNLLGANPSSIAESNASSRKNSGSSPLPNLSFNTVLPHFSYSDLEYATDNFNEKPLEEKGRFLGAGSFGKVYLALDLAMVGKPVAVKKLILNSNVVLTEDDSITKQFRNEVEVLCKYKHENLLSIIGYSCDGATYCLLYEYIPGGPLKDRLRSSTKLVWTERLYIAFGTAKAVSYLHTAFDTTLLHRDIKSANILLDSTNKPKLGDFGLIKLLPNQLDVTGTIWGTSVYMAPEALRGEQSVKMDSFSFGVVLLELLTSLSVVDSDRPRSYLVQYVEETCPESIDALLDKSVGTWNLGDVNFGQELYSIARACLKDVEMRPTMQEVTVQLTNLVERFPQKQVP